MWLWYYEELVCGVGLGSVGGDAVIYAFRGNIFPQGSVYLFAVPPAGLHDLPQLLRTLLIFHVKSCGKSAEASLPPCDCGRQLAIQCDH